MSEWESNGPGGADAVLLPASEPPSCQVLYSTLYRHHLFMRLEKWVLSPKARWSASRGAQPLHRWPGAQYTEHISVPFSRLRLPPEPSASPQKASQCLLCFTALDTDKHHFPELSWKNSIEWIWSSRKDLPGLGIKAQSDSWSKEPEEWGRKKAAGT